uniref:Uncharacterized protein n=1 Tax=Amphimedon queenslandica TaxID=400682 RepID=A0A1X7UNV5_AMPQE
CTISKVIADKSSYSRAVLYYVHVENPNYCCSISSDDIFSMLYIVYALEDLLVMGMNIKGEVNTVLGLFV